MKNIGYIGPMNYIIKINCSCSPYFSNAGVENLNNVFNSPLWPYISPIGKYWYELTSLRFKCLFFVENIVNWGFIKSY